MTTTSSVDPYALLNGSKTNPAPASPNDALGQNAFLKLMLAQLRNQDPMKPQDPTQFLSQLAQFTQVTSTQNVEQSIRGLSDSLRSTQVLNGATLVGRDVLAPGTTATIESGGTVAGALDVPKGVTSAKIIVNDAAGAQVRTFELAQGAEGFTSFTWDGKTDSGVTAPAGQYTFKAVANAAGEAVSLDPMLTSRVSSVTIDPSSGSLTLNTSTGAVPLTHVRRVL